MENCIFCKIIKKESEAVIVYESEDLLVFLDRWPVREGHCQIISRCHIACFDELPEDLAAKMIHCAQRLARQMKKVYQVDRVAFAFSGNDVAHVHAHLFPIYERGDLTSKRYIENADEIKFNDAHLQVDSIELEQVKSRLLKNLSD